MYRGLFAEYLMQYDNSSMKHVILISKVAL